VFWWNRRHQTLPSRIADTCSRRAGRGARHRVRAAGDEQVRAAYSGRGLRREAQTGEEESMNAVELTRQLSRRYHQSPQPERPCASGFGNLLAIQVTAWRRTSSRPDAPASSPAAKAPALRSASAGHLDTVPLARLPGRGTPSAAEVTRQALRPRLERHEERHRRDGRSALRLAKTPLRKAGSSLVLLAGRRRMRRSTHSPKVPGALGRAGAMVVRGTTGKPAGHRNIRARSVAARTRGVTAHG